MSNATTAAKGWTPTQFGAVQLIACTIFFALLSRAGGEERQARNYLAGAETRLAEDLQYLSSDELAGRDVGSPGIELAGQFIAERFRQLGLKTDSFSGNPFQEFTIPGPPKLGETERNRLSFSGIAGLPELALGVDYTPVALGNAGSFSGEVVFAGYGITAPEQNYDDYAGLDVVGKVVIILRKEPNQNDPNSKFDGQRPSQHAFFSTKELNAALHRAAAMIVVNDGATVNAAGRDQMPDVSGAGSAVSDQQIPTLYCARGVVDQLLRSTGESLAELEAAIDAQVAPRSRVLTGIQCQGETKIVQSRTPVRNVVGFLPGVGALADQTIVIGAHYDHVGMGGLGSLAPGTIEIHNGADDNASGTTTLLEVARRMVEQTASDRRGIVFIAFTGEERGLLGSKHYVRNPRWPLEQTVAMLNMDMVGRMEGDNLTVYGTGTATQFDGLIDRLGEKASLVIDKEPAGFGPSDHSSFYEVDIPVFHFFTGLHNDYHRPSDDFEKANIAGMARVADLVAAVTWELATIAERPTLIKSAAVAQIGRGQRPMRGVLGVRLNSNTSDSVEVEAVMPGSAAELAGVKSRDIIVGIGDDVIQSLSDLHGKLSVLKPGETITVRLIRDGQSLQVTLVLQGG